MWTMLHCAISIRYNKTGKVVDIYKYYYCYYYMLYHSNLIFRQISSPYSIVIQYIHKCSLICIFLAWGIRPVRGRHLYSTLNKWNWSDYENKFKLGYHIFCSNGNAATISVVLEPVVQESVTRHMAA